MRIVATGATGSIGSAVVRRPRAETTHDLVGLARRPAEGPDSHGVDRRSTALGKETCHDALAEAFTGADAVGRLAWACQPSHDPAHGEAFRSGPVAVRWQA
ncbi:NAD(P)H-binding protein [Streptomyces sp. NPDC058374]|uniref:NAD(P)H-binding protein n=1 Tax=unclassified Streptomyces TaxID=2593676 RepID=UPI003668D77A